MESLFITSSAIASTDAITTAVKIDRKPLIKDEYFEYSDKEAAKRRSSINRERRKGMGKRNVDWLVRDVCEVRSEAIIRAVEQLPCLWNLECESYRNKSKRRQGWSAVSRMLIHDFENKNLSERQKIEKEIQSKWKNIRDCYVRDVRRRNGKGLKSRSNRTREYIHAGLLSFLGNPLVTEHDSVQALKTDSEISSDFILDAVVKPFFNHSEVNCDWIKQETLEEKLGVILEERSLKDDEDSAFFSTLLPTIQNLNPEQKVEFRLEVLQVLRQIATKQLVDVNFTV